MVVTRSKKNFFWYQHSTGDEQQSLYAILSCRNILKRGAVFVWDFYTPVLSIFVMLSMHILTKVSNLQCSCPVSVFIYISKVFRFLCWPHQRFPALKKLTPQGKKKKNQVEPITLHGMQHREIISALSDVVCTTNGGKRFSRLFSGSKICISSNVPNHEAGKNCKWGNSLKLFCVAAAHLPLLLTLVLWRFPEI